MSIRSKRQSSGFALTHPNQDVIEKDVRRALAEDIGAGDATSALITPSAIANARVICREPSVLCGQPWFTNVFAQLEPKINITWNASDGDVIDTNDEICRLTGPARALLTGERTALNFLQLLSGTATFTQQCVRTVEGTHAKILDTRKTLPGLRLAQKYAVRCGGATNHRIGLFDAFLIKENHTVAAGSIGAAVQIARKNNPELTLEVEVETLDQVDQAIDAGADVIMLDNFDPAGIKMAVSRTAKRARLEVSGNVTVAGLRELAETGVDYVSIGALTKNLRAIDFSLRYT